MAAGIYLLLIWGYIALPSAQLFAAFTALVMSAALYLWFHEGTAILASLQASSKVSPLSIPAAAQVYPSVKRSTVQSSADATLKLNALKDELTDQYAQFGRDQVRLNSRGLGTWHQTSSSKAKRDNDGRGNE